jgi:hypothetical protein
MASFKDLEVDMTTKLRWISERLFSKTITILEAIHRPVLYLTASVI